MKGTCPKCKSPDQYGDNCDNCGQHLQPDRFDRSGQHALRRQAGNSQCRTHLFIELEPLHEFLERVDADQRRICSRKSPIILKGHFLGEPLRDWDVSRPAPYFGFEIPDSPGNYWYVWFDAPIGYMASLQQWCERTRRAIRRLVAARTRCRNQRPVEIHHFIGKDITYFHTLFWPGMLKTAGFKLPTKVHIHGFLTVGGEKMSKSKGTFIQAATYLKHLEPGLPALLLRQQTRPAR